LRVEKRETKRQQTLARRKAELQAETRGDSADAPADPPLTLLGMGRGLLSWSQCPAPLTAVVNRERDAHGQVPVGERAAELPGTALLFPLFATYDRRYGRQPDLAGRGGGTAGGPTPGEE
jgi:hypothetical protein